MHARKTVCGNEFATYLPPRFSVTEQTKVDWFIGNRQKGLQSSDESEKANRRQKKSSKATHYYLDTKRHNIMTTLGC